jgi:hypothetical protein
VATIGCPKPEELHPVLFRVPPLLILSYRRRIFKLDLYRVSLNISSRRKHIVIIEEGYDAIDAHSTSGELLRLLLRGAGVRGQVSKG